MYTFTVIEDGVLTKDPLSIENTLWANTVVALGEHLVLMLALVLMKREAFTLIEDGCKRTLSI